MKKTAFSLIEILIATILVGLAVTALLVASSSMTIANGAGTDLSTAEFLIEQIRELTALLPLTMMIWTILMMRVFLHRLMLTGMF
jgi:hypothetical protein